MTLAQVVILIVLLGWLGGILLVVVGILDGRT